MREIPALPVKNTFWPESAALRTAWTMWTISWKLSQTEQQRVVDLNARCHELALRTKTEHRTREHFFPSGDVVFLQQHHIDHFTTLLYEIISRVVY